MRVAVPITQNFFTWLGGLNYLRTVVTAVSEHASGEVEPVLVIPRSRPSGILDGFPAQTERVETQIFDVPSPAWAARTAVTRATRHDAGLERLLRRRGIDLLSHHEPLGAGAGVPTLSWVPDVQHRRLPELFTGRELRGRDRSLRLMSRHSAAIVVSSEAGKRDLAAAAPDAAERIHVLHFVPDLPGEPAPSAVSEVLGRYGLDRYLYLPNQLWVHKNHRIVVEALGLLRAEGRPVSVVATGDTVDPRDPGLARELAERSQQLGVADDLRVLGLVPYGEVRALMTGAVALVNPSLFEGWSTTVEEARALGKRTVLSDIDVHREQDPPGALFADPHDPAAFAAALRAAWDEHDPSAERERRDRAQAEHPVRRREFAERYVEICAQTTR